MLKHILAVVVIAFAWTAVSVFKLPPWVGLVVSATQVLVTGVIYLIQQIRARKAARRLERAMVTQSDRHAGAVRPEQQASIVALKSEFLKAVGALKASRLGKGGVAALYALPWYAIIGPPGAGKSTALRNSGLPFPYLSGDGGAVRGIGGTRNCDWWLTNEAILLDTSGRYTTDDDDRDEWFAFLDLLRKSRPRQPINGVLVAVSVSDLMGASDPEMEQLALRVRGRMDELSARLTVVPPVYVLFTKCDLIDGFVDLFEDLKKADRGQIWGFTLPLAPDPRPLESVLGERLDELADSVEKRALRRMGQERRLEAREKVYSFPQQFGLLKPRLEPFLATLFAANVFKEPPLLRGVYFTSGTQEGRPIDRVMSAMAESFGVAPHLPAQAPVVESKSYFLRDVFLNVVFPDRGLVAKTRLAATALRRRAYLVGAGVLGVALLFSSLPAWSYMKNRKLIASTAAIVSDVAARRHSPGAGAISLDQLEPLRRRVDLLRTYELDGPPATLGLGLYKGGTLYPYVRALYSDVLRRDMLAPIAAHTIAELEAFAKDPPPQGYDPRHYEELKLYLLLSGPREPGEPAPVGPLGNWTAQRIVTGWAAALGGDRTPEELAVMTSHARLFVTLLASDQALALPRDAALVKRLRMALAAVPIERVVLDPIVSELSAQGYDLTVETILGGGSGSIESKRRVRGAFTKQAWETVVKPRLDDAKAVLEPWVLGAEAGRRDRPEALAKRLRSRYFELYIQEWQDFLASLHVKEAQSQVEALTILQGLTRGVPAPMGRIMRTVAENTRLSGDGLVDKGVALVSHGAGARGKAAVGAAQGALADPPDGTIGPGEVEIAFAPFSDFGVPRPSPPSLASGAAPPPPPAVTLDVYQEQLNFVRDALMTYLENPADASALSARLGTARTTVKGLIEQQEVGWRPRFYALLWPAIDGASGSTVIDIAKGKGLKWCNEVVVPFDRGLKGRYPFSPGGQDAPLADVMDYYKPDGVVWTFFQAQLGADIQRAGERFEFSRRLGETSGFSSALLAFLTRSLEITSVLFPSGAKDPGVEFEVSLRPAPGVASIQLEVDGQVVKTQNEPDTWHKLRWPGEGKSRGATIRVKGERNLSETLNQQGEWGLFRLLEQGKVSASLSSRMFSVTWTLRSRPGVQIVVDIKPTRSESPFFGAARRGSPKLLAPFRSGDTPPPHAITRGGGCQVN